MLDITIGHNLKIWAPLKKLFPLLVSQPASAYIQVCILLSSLPHKASALGKFYFTSPQPIKPKEASDSDFTIEDVTLWPGMRFSLRSQCKRCFAGRLHKDQPWHEFSSIYTRLYTMFDYSWGIDKQYRLNQVRLKVEIE